MRRLGIVGVGLVGGSVALAARRAWPGIDIRGVDEARAGDPAARRIVDRMGKLEDLSGADLIVLAAPVAENVALLRRLDALAGAGSSPTSAEPSGPLQKRPRTWPHRLRRRPSDGGRRDVGPSHARADLFDGRPWFLTRGEASHDAVSNVEAFVTALGARPVQSTPPRTIA